MHVKVKTLKPKKSQPLMLNKFARSSAPRWFDTFDSGQVSDLTGR